MFQYMLENQNWILPTSIVLGILITTIIISIGKKRAASCPTPRLMLEEMAMTKIREAFWKSPTARDFGDLCEKIKESTMALADTYDGNKKS